MLILSRLLYNYQMPSDGGSSNDNGSGGSSGGGNSGSGGGNSSGAASGPAGAEAAAAANGMGVGDGQGAGQAGHSDNNGLTSGFNTNTPEPGSLSQGYFSSQLSGLNGLNNQTVDIGPTQSNADKMFGQGPTVEAARALNAFNLGATSYSTNRLTGVTTYNGISSGILGALGIKQDMHSIQGQMLGIEDEMAADALEALNLNVTNLNISITEDLASVIAGALFGAPALSIATSTVNLATDVALSNGMIDQNTANHIHFTMAVVNFAMQLKSTIDMTSMTMEAYSQMTTTGKLAAVAFTATQAYNTYSSFIGLENLAAKYGFVSTDITAADLDGFDRDEGSKEQYEAAGSLSVLAAYEKLLQWKVANNPGLQNDKRITAEDVFDKMAGSVIYNAFFGGGMFTHPLNPSNQDLASVGNRVKFNPYAMQSLLGSDLEFQKNTINASGKVSNNSRSIAYAKNVIIRKIIKLQESLNNVANQYNADNNKRTQYVNQYNDIVSTWNSHPSGYDYKAGQSQLDALKTKINSYNSIFKGYEATIKSTQTNITKLTKRL